MNVGASIYSVVNKLFIEEHPRLLKQIETLESIEKMQSDFQQEVEHVQGLLFLAFTIPH